MISFRYHVVSLVAVLLALAAGILLGSGPLQRGDAAGGADTGDAQALAAAQSRMDAAEQRLVFADSFARATSSEIIDGRLDGRAVTLVRLPGADEATVADLADMVNQAGGSVTAQVSIGEQLLDVANRQLVAELATQMHASAEQAVEVPAGASGYERMGLLVAHAVASTKNGGADIDRAGDSVLAGVSTADLVNSQGNIERRGSLVVVVAGEPFGTADQRSGAGSILNTMVTAFDRSSDGVVLAGPVEAAAEDGLVGALRADPTAASDVSSVDVADLAAGAVVTVLTLAREAEGTSGHYGSAASADGALPGDDALEG